VKWIDEVLQIALVSQPVPLAAPAVVAPPPVEDKPARRAGRRSLKPSSAH
jgi:hypothetical protein